MSNQSPEYVQSYIADLIQKAKVAQKEYERTFTTQLQVDTVVHAIGKAVYDSAMVLCEEAVAETGMGNLEGKLAKLRSVSLRNWNFMKGRPSVGIIDDFTEPGIKVVAKPMGVIGAVMPSTNPIATVIANSMAALKARNAIIIAAHPASAHGSIHTVNIIRGALKEVGAPIDLVQCIEEPSIAMTNALLKEADANIATGGAGMVKSVYSAGRPAYGVGQGNCQAIVDADYDDFDRVAAMVVFNRSIDMGVPCTGEQTLHIPAEREAEMVESLKKAGAYIVEDPAVIDHIREILFPTDSINRAVVGRSPQKLGEMFGIDVPEGAKVIAFKNQAKGMEDLLCKEILCPIIRYTTYTKFEDAVDAAIANLEQKKGILLNAVNTLRNLGFENPKVAALAASEVVNPKIPDSMDAAKLAEMNREGVIANCVVEGPISMDIALSEKAAKKKGFESQIAGDPDVLLMPSVLAGNLAIKLLGRFVAVKTVSVVAGAAVPIVLTSRGVPHINKYRAICLAAAAAGSAEN